jgi:hypothetical protein
MAYNTLGIAWAFEKVSFYYFKETICGSIYAQLLPLDFTLKH